MAWGSATAWAAADRPVPERVYLSFLKDSVLDIRGGATSQDLFFQLPAHVRMVEGSTFHLVLRGPPVLWADLCAVRVMLNRTVLFEGQSGSQLSEAEEPPVLRLALPLPAEVLEAAWNRLRLEFTWRSPTVEGALPVSETSWQIRDTDSFVALVYERLPLFPEVRRFPQSMVEEELLRSPFVPPTPSEPVVALLLPRSRREVHWRAVSVLGACLGKPGYLRSGRVGPIESWDQERLQRNGLMIARADELRDVALPEEVRQTLTTLTNGQGLVAESILGAFPNERRWIFLAGADDAGLEKALLTLVHDAKRTELPPNPAIVEESPYALEPGDAESEDGWTRMPLRVMPREGNTLQGLFESRRELTDWVLPPTFETGPGGYLDIGFEHGTNLTADSFLEIRLQGQVLGSVSLTSETARGGRARVPVPEGIRGAGAMPFQIRAVLNMPNVPCDPDVNAQAWLRLLDPPQLRCPSRPIQVDDLRHAQTYLMSDPSLRRTTFLIPERSTDTELNWLFSFSKSLGERMPFAAVLWPEVLGYGPDRLPPPERLRGRSVLVLGSVWDWPHGMIEDSRLMVRPGRNTNEVRLQGRRCLVADLEPSLALLNLVSAPWDPEQRIMVGGGWRTYQLDGLTRMLTEPDAIPNMFGLCAAMDAQSRAAAYDPRQRPSESLEDSLTRRIPPGFSTADTIEWRYAREARARHFAQRSFTISVWVGLGLILLVGGRVWLLWERSRMDRQWNRRGGGDAS